MDRTSRRAVIVGIVIERSPDEIWADIRNIGSHVSWMADAVAIRFLTDTTEGVGARFECDTKVGPFSLTDIMEITSWEEGRRMGVKHVGLVEGTGEFVLRDLGSGRTDFGWEEDLTFPWWMGGAIGAFCARPILRSIWKRNLIRLKTRIESQPTNP